MLLQNKRSFTLIEMLIVIVIIGILAAALVPRLLALQVRARNTQRTVAVKQISDMVKVHYLDHGNFPLNLPILLNSGYATSLPLDPLVPNNDPCGLVSHGWVLNGSSTGWYAWDSVQHNGWLYNRSLSAVNGYKYAVVGARMENDGSINSRSFPVTFNTGLTILCVQSTISHFNTLQSWSVDGVGGNGMSIKNAYTNTPVAGKAGWHLERMEY